MTQMSRSLVGPPSPRITDPASRMPATSGRAAYSSTTAPAAARYGGVNWISGFAPIMPAPPTRAAKQPLPSRRKAQAARPHAEPGIADDQVVEHVDVEQLARRHDLLGDFDILPRRGGVAAGMV